LHENNSSDVTIEKHETLFDSKFNLTKTADGDLAALLQRERLILKMFETHQVSIITDDKALLSCRINPEHFTHDFYAAAPYLEQYYSNLSAIQDFTGCQFDLAIDGDFNSQYQIAFVLKNSLENRWVKNNSDFDNQLRCVLSFIWPQIHLGQPRNRWPAR